jgi:hypothetical protein
MCWSNLQRVPPEWNPRVGKGAGACAGEVPRVGAARKSAPLPTLRIRSTFIATRCTIAPRGESGIREAFENIRHRMLYARRNFPPPQ